MNKQDKFEQYLKKEMGEMKYDGEDRMWESFKHQVPSVSPLQQLITWIAPVVVVGVIGVGLYVYSDSGKMADILVGMSDHPIEELTQHVNNEKDESDELDANVKQTINEIQLDNPIEKINDVDTDIAKANLNTTEEYESKAKDSKQLESKAKRLTPLQSSVVDLNSGESKSISNEIGDHVSNQKIDPSLPLKGNESNQKDRGEDNRNSTGVNGSASTVNLGSQSKISSLNFLGGKASLLAMNNATLLMTANLADHVRKENARWIGFVGSAIGSTGLQAQSLGLSYNNPISKRIDLALTIGGQYEVGNIVSQDSITTTINISIVETKRDKDLNDLASIYLSAIPMFKFGQFGIGIGPKLSYGVYNTFNVMEISTGINNGEFNAYLYSIGSKSTLNQDWSSLNRLRIGGDLVLDYQTKSRFGIQLHLSKNFTTLIKDDLAVTDRSNSPLTIGLQLNYLIKY